MDIDEVKDDAVTILAPSEGLNTQTCAPFEKKLISVLDAKVRLVVVDLKKVDYLSSAALRVLLMVTRRLIRAGGKLVICCLRDEVRKVFSISGFDRDFTIVDVRADAVALAKATPLPPLKEDAKKPKTEARVPAAPAPAAAAAPADNPFAAQFAAAAKAAPSPAAEAEPTAEPKSEPAEPPTVMAEESRPNVAAAQALKILASGELDSPWTRWPSGSISDGLVARILDRLAL